VASRRPSPPGVQPPPRPLPAATVVPLRDGREGLEVLLLERAPRGDGEPAPWVFPGGKIDPGDGPLRPGAEDPVARRAAAREAREEAGLALAPEALVPLSRWITPEISPRRFDTWFYLAALEADAAVRVDGGEIAAHRWLPPREALALHREREGLRLAPPTFVTLAWLEAHCDVAAALEVLGPAEVLTFRPRICPARSRSGACVLYPGDAGYEAGDPARPGPRHRLWTGPEGYRYECHVPGLGPSVSFR